MLTFSLHGVPRPTEGAAVAAAIAEALGNFSSMGDKVHVHVMQVIKIDGDYQAVIQIALEPKPDDPEEVIQEYKKKHRKEIEPKPKLKPMPALEIKEGHRAHYRHDYEPDVHVYIPSPELPDISYRHHLMHPHPDYHYHLLGKGSLWEASLHLHPDMDLHGAASPAAPDITPAPEAALDIDLKPRARRKYGLMFDLNKDDDAA